MARVQVKDGDAWRWLSVSEESLLLHSDLLHLADYISLPSGVGSVVSEDEYGLPVLDGKTPKELAEVITRECSVKTNTYTSLMEYRLNALRGLWSALRLREKKQRDKKHEEGNRGSGTKTTQKGEGFASRVSLVLIFPILQSLSKLDPSLSQETAGLLLESLRACEPLSLSTEPTDCINSLENLLCSWLTSAREGTEMLERQVQVAASALVALAVAVGTGGLLLRTVNMLQSLDSTHPHLNLLVPKILHKLLQEHVVLEEPPTLTSDAHLQCWGYDDQRVQDDDNSDGPRSIVFDGQYIYVTVATGKTLLQLGTGINGTIRGYIYNRADIEKGWITLVDRSDKLLYRKQSSDEKHNQPFLSLLDRNTLKDCGSVKAEFPLPESHMTLYLMSDGHLVYWLYSLKQQDSITHPITGEKSKHHSLYLQILEFEDRGTAGYCMIPHQERILLKKVISEEKGASDNMMKALMRAGSSYASISTLLGGGKDDTTTSCGLGLKQLQNGAAYCTGSSLVLVTGPPVVSGSRSLFGSGAASSKSLCLSFSYSLSSGNLVTQSELLPSQQLHCGLNKGSTVQSLALSYDHRNHCVWSVCDEWIDVWTCFGKVKPAAHILALRMGKPSLNDLIPNTLESDTDTISIGRAVELLLRHSGIESCRLTPGKDFSVPVAHSLTLKFLEHCCDILEYSIHRNYLDNALTIVITLQAVLPAYLTSVKYPPESLNILRDKIRNSIWTLVTMEECPSALRTETQKLICHNCEKLFLYNDEEGHKFVSTLNSSSSPELIDLSQELLVEVARRLRPASEVSPAILKLCPLIIDGLERDSTAAIKTVQSSSTGGDEEIIKPVFTPTLQCGSAILNVTLRSITNCLEDIKKHSDEDETDEMKKLQEKLDDQRTHLMEICTSLKIFEICEKTLGCISELANSLSISDVERKDKDEKDKEREEGGRGEGGEGGRGEGGEGGGEGGQSEGGGEGESEGGDGGEGNGSEGNEGCEVQKEQVIIQALERSSKSTVLGSLLLPLLAVLSDTNICSLPLAASLLTSLTNLGKLNAEVCSTLYTNYKNIKVPAPWASGRLVETIHPVRDNYKFKETVSFPGARHLYLKFDPRCSSQYDYDKVLVYAGDSPSSTKVAEYGGNSHGFGSRSVLGKGWPKDLVKVDGDKVTFTFEMKSGREHSTPDKAMWGFACVVRPQETAEDSPSGLPFLLDLYLSLSSVNCSLIGQLFEGNPPTPDEIKCRTLMESSLLQRCVWSDTVIPFGGVSPGGSRKSILPSFLDKLRSSVSKPRPTLRQSISDILQVDLLEDLILSTCLKHHGVHSPLSLLVEKQLETHRELVDEIFVRINGLERRLQALAELESNWWSDVEEVVSGNSEISQVFFYGLQQESSTKSFELLCCLMGVTLTNDFYAALKQLQELMEKDIQLHKDEEKTIDTYSKTRALVTGVLDRSRLLLQVNISPPTPSTQTTPSHIARSVSVPAHHFDSTRPLRRQRSDGNAFVTPLLVDLPSEGNELTLLDEIFQFIGAKPEEAVSCKSFLLAASQQQQRSVDRVRALGFLQSILTVQQLGSTVEHILACVGGVLQNGPHVTDISCSGNVPHVRNVFADVMHAVVELASIQPAACINTIALLSIVPYTRKEEACLVRSGLVKLLDELCSLSNLPQGASSGEIEGEEEGEAVQRVTALAWAAFQVLADRCVSWETRSMGFISSGLAQQVSLLLTNHLSRAMDSLVASESGTSDTLQEALSMLLGLARSFMGRTILSQPACVSKLLLLLTDQRPSPKLVLIALQLCRIALPLMTIAECSQVTIPPHPTLTGSLQSGNLAASIITLLMAKLAEYLIPSVSQVSQRPVQDQDSSSTEESAPTPYSTGYHDMDESGQASVYIHRRNNESAAEILHLLLNQDPRQLSQRMETVLRLDQALTDDGKAEIYTDSYRSCFRRAVRWANMGFIVSIEPPVGSSGNSSSGTESDLKKAKAESACKKKNLELLKTDPPRPFLSGTVAYSLASEIIALLNGLLADPDAAHVWKKAIEDVLKTSLNTVPRYVPELEEYCTDVHSCMAQSKTPPPPDEHLSAACLANAIFAALGGFKDTVRPSMKVKLIGEGIEDCMGTVISISERRGIAHIQFPDDKYCFGVNQTLEAPLSRLQPPEVGSLPLQQLNLQEHLSKALVSVLSTYSPFISLPHSGMDATLPAMSLCRLFAELRTRACMSLSHHGHNKQFRDLILRDCDLKQFLKQAESCQPGERVSVIEIHCMNLRMLYRDCARPPPPKIERPRIERKRFYLDISRQWPPIKSCSFSHHFTSIVYQGATTSSGGGGGSEEDTQDKPKGAFIVTNSPIPPQAPSFYWELELTSLDSGSNIPHLTFGYCSDPKKPVEGESWSYLEGTCLLRSTGRGCQVHGEDRIQWNKINLEGPLKTGDIVGCGWIKEETPEIKNVVYFTLNGVRIEQQFKDTPTDMYPFVHVQKKGMRLKLNFGDRPFSYPEGHTHRDAADVIEGETSEYVVALFKELPFHPSDSDYEDEKIPDIETKIDSKDKLKAEPLVIGPPCVNLEVSESLPKNYTYNSETSQLYPLTSSFDTMLESGPLIRPGGGSNQEEEEEEGDGRGTQAEEDLHSLLVKAWEAKVFPMIQRRFRNDQERKNGLEQIRGALQLGMESIAQETVEFLYEENGGLPRDLHFPTLDDVKLDLETFTINRVKKGSAVVIQKELPYSRCGVRAMQKTQGLTGIVLSVDEANELVQVECYLPSDGALVRFWYPVVYLERPPKGFRKPSALRGAESVNILVHRELLRCESSLAAMYCRSALLNLYSYVPTIPPSLSMPSYLSLLACHHFSQPSVEGLCATTSPSLCPSLQRSILTVLSSPQDIFYSDPYPVVQGCSKWLVNPSQEDFTSVVMELCEKLSNTSKGLGRGEYPIPDGKDYTDVCCPGASFIVVSCSEEKPKSDSKASYKYPWAKVYSYRGGQGKAGQMPLQEVIRYPNEIPQSAIHQYCGPTHPCLILPTDRIHLRLGGCSPHPGRHLTVVGVPQLLPLLMTFSHSLSMKTYKSVQFDKKPSNIDACCIGLSSCLSPLINVIYQMGCAPVLIERIFKSISNILWTLNTVLSVDSTQFSPIPAKFIQGLIQELENVYEFECTAFNPSGNKPKTFPSEGSISAGGSGKFSTYFQALLEVVLAIRQYMFLYHEKQSIMPTSPSSDSKRMEKKDVQAKIPFWLNYITRVAYLMQRINQQRPIDREFYNSFKKSLPAKPESRFLVLTGINPDLEKEVALETIMKLCNQYGGLSVSEVYLPSKEIVVMVEEKKDKAEEVDATSENPPAKPVVEKVKLFVVGGAVLELSSSDKTSAVSSAILSCDQLQGEKKGLSVSSVSHDLKCGEDKKGNEVLQEYLHLRLFGEKGLKEAVSTVLLDIYNSARYSDKTVLKKNLEEKDVAETYLRVFLQQVVSDRDYKKTLSSLCEGKKGLETMSEVKFLDWVEKEGRRDVRCVWCGLFAAGYDTNLMRCGYLPADAYVCSPDPVKDHALILHVDSVCRKLDVVSSQLQAWDITLSEADLTSSNMVPLQGQSISEIRLRFLQLKQLNRQLPWLLPLVDLCSTHPLSLGSLLSNMAPFLFYDVKISFLHSVLNSSTRRSLDQAPPEIKMDPLETVGDLPSTVLETQFCQASRQMLTVPSPKLCVSLASGGDPTYAFNVKLAGEEVHGTSGSFRHFLWQVVRELQSPLLPILTLCPSHSAGINKGKHILAPGPMTFSEEKLLEFFGQLLGVAIRADVPVALDLLQCFWKSLRKEELTELDLKEADTITHSLTERIIASDESTFKELVSNISRDESRTDNDRDGLRFVYQNMNSVEEELCVGGAEMTVNFSNRVEYAQAIRSFRLKELSSQDRMTAIRCGLASVIPIQLLSVLTASDLDLRVCGLPDVDLQYLKHHTTYHVGLMESDIHIKYFWNALESFSQEELRKFIKFACNQERIPFGQPCRGGKDVVTHVPPYPMKIAPPDGQGPPDSRYIRAETCMFLVKLPQYSSQEIMNERLKYAINCREDPLSG